MKPHEKQLEKGTEHPRRSSEKGMSIWKGNFVTRLALAATLILGTAACSKNDTGTESTKGRNHA